MLRMATPEQVADVGLALAPVRGVSAGSQAERLRGPFPVRAGEAGDLDRQPLPQPGLAVHRRDRVQRHLSQQPPLSRPKVQTGIGPHKPSRRTGSPPACDRQVPVT